MVRTVSAKASAVKISNVAQMANVTVNVLTVTVKKMKRLKKNPKNKHEKTTGRRHRHSHFQ